MKSKRSVAERLLAAVLSLILLVGLLPASALKAHAAVLMTVSSDPEGEITYVTEYDQSINVDGAEITYDPVRDGWFVTIRVEYYTGEIQTEAKKLEPTDDSNTVEVDFSVNCDWDQDGDTDCTVAMVGTVTLVGATQMLSISGDSLVYGGQTIYTVTGIESGAVPVFEITKGTENAKIVSTDGNTVTVEAKNVGAFALKASVDGDEYYKGAEVLKELTVEMAAQNCSISGATTIGANSTATIEVIGREPGTSVVFSVEGNESGIVALDDNGDGTAKITGLKAGTVKVFATVSGTENYNGTTVSAEITVARIAPGSYGFLVSEGEVTFGKTGTYIITIPEYYEGTGIAIGNPSVVSAELVEITDESTGTTSYQVVVTATAVGSTTIQVSMTDEDSVYENVNSTLSITVNKADQDALRITGCDTDVIYNEYENNQLTLNVSGGSTDGKVTYTSSNPEVASISDNVLTVHKAGTIQISATMAGDSNYEDVTSEAVTVVISKAKQDLTLNETSATAEENATSYKIAWSSATGNYADGKFSYTVTKQDDTMSGSSVGEDGVITIGDGDYGTMTVLVSNIGDECYNAWAGESFTLTVNQLVVETGDYTLTGTMGNNGWYKSVVEITRENYLLAQHVENSGGKGPNKTQESFSSVFYWSTEGENTVVLCVKQADSTGNGKNSTAHNQTIGTIKIDTANPESSENYTYSSGWEGFLDFISAGFYNADLTVTITAKDSTSGVAEIHYCYDGENWVTVTCDGDKEESVSFTISEDYKGNIQYYAVDMAGNVEGESKSDDIVVDYVNPTRTVTWSEAKLIVDSETLKTVEEFDYSSEDNSVNLYYNGSATATIVITEANFGERYITIKDNGSKINGVSWSSEGEVHTATITLTSEGAHILTVEGTDNSGRALDSYTSDTIVIDNTNPVISINPDNSRNHVYYDSAQTITLSIEEANFRADEVNITVTAENAAGVNLGVTYSAGEWYVDERNNDIHKLDLTFDADANYIIDVSYTDLALLHANDLAPQSFSVDTTDPINLEITYTDAVWRQVLEAVTFGYYNAQMTVTISAEDATSGVAAIYYNYNGDWLFAEPDSEGKISFEIDPEFKGNVKYYAADKAGNQSDVTDGKETLIIDTIKPGIDVIWSDAVTVKDNTRYYAGEAVATVTITEANFFDGADVKINGAAFDGEWKAATDEKGDKIEDAWVNTITLVDEGDHAVTISYTDRSKNEMEKYTSETIVIDYTAPIISASINTGSTRQYYNQSQTVTITVTEKNFDASLVNINIAARDSSGSSTNDNVSYGEWVDAGNDVHTLNISFAGDANYTLNANCKDLAGRSASLAEQLFTVDKTAPANMTITYSTSVLSQILSGVTFNYYDAPVTVTISAVDTTAGIENFSYQYTLNKGVSSVNKGGSGTVAATQHGNTYTASFQVPASVLAAANQFNGFISFTATDRSSNTSTETHQGSRTVVVDNISPTSTVTYNTPHQQANNISYYAGNIEATININEANFDAGDVVVTVNKDGKAYAVNVAWVNNSADSHTGRFTLTEDGDYTVTVSYTDKSGNHMATYTSNQLTLDTTAPTIDVSNIVANSANKDAEYGFVITINDTNLDVASMNPVLMAVLRNENGLYSTTQIDLGTPVAVVAGQTYTYTVENLPEDALYTLSYEVMDMAGNVTNTAILDDGAEYGEVQFSINRNGSAFGFGDEYTETVVNQYYVYEVYDDVVIVEVNVDPIEDYVVLLNGEELTEGSDYTTEQSSASGEWSKRTYVINKDLFAEEGEYSVVVSSKDKTETTAYSDVKNLSVAFVVDQTAPVLTISGLESGGRYQTNEQTVTVIPTDDGGCLYSMKVIVLDSKGNPLTDEAGNDISVRFDMSGEDFLKYLEENDGKATFTVPEGLNNQVQVICNDCAVNADGLTNEYKELFDRVTVSQNQLVIFYANTPVFVGTIFGVLALLFLIIFLLKRKKKDKAAA